MSRNTPSVKLLNIVSIFNAAEGEKDAKVQYAAEVVAGDVSASAVSTYDCPVCRRAQILDLDRLQVRKIFPPPLVSCNVDVLSTLARRS